MNNLARIILESYLFEKKTLSEDEIEKIQPVAKEKIPVFITVRDGNTVVGSTGRIYPAEESL
jgi:AMMECR1 domain-containing protein